ncbi:MAG: PstS family phosphate ABC transporter substrate-binding protein [Pseudomonadota bacterium]
MKIATFLLSSLLSAHALAGLTGQVRIDGSSTVFPISEAVAEEFQKANAGVKVTVAQSGTGGGFKKFVANEIDISDASRTIKKEEAEAAQKANVLWTEVPIAYDGITVVVNPKNTWVKTLTMEQLKKIWEPESKVKTWKDVDASWPDSKIKLYGPGADSGTFDYFTEHVNGKAKAIRPDFTASEDDNVLVKGVAGDKDALGYFGISYYEANAKKLKSVAIAGTDGKFVSPTVETVKDGTYPISRPLFIYVNHASLARAEVANFVSYYLSNAKKLVAETGYVPMTEAQYKAGMAKIAAIKK